MIRAIFAFLVPLVVLGGALVGGWWLLNILRGVDEAHMAALYNAPPPSTAPADDSAIRPAPGPYAWCAKYDPQQTVAARIAPPRGYARMVQEDKSSFPYWLRNLPTRPASPADPRHVLDIDFGDAKIAQPVHNILRLRDEYRYYVRRFSALKFKLPSGDFLDFGLWSEGRRPTIENDKVTWSNPSRATTRDQSYSNFRNYMDLCFKTAGEMSLLGQFDRQPNSRNLQVGQVFYMDGNPGQAVIVVDMVQSERGMRRAFLLAEPTATGLHIVRNTRPADTAIHPWFDVVMGQAVTCPSGKFSPRDLRRFK